MLMTLTLMVGTLWLTPAAFAQNRAGDIGAGPIEGTWTVTGSERDGSPWREIAGATMTITGAQFTVQFANNGPLYKGDVEADRRTAGVRLHPERGTRGGQGLAGACLLERPAPEDLLQLSCGWRQAELADDVARRGDDADWAAPEVTVRH